MSLEYDASGNVDAWNVVVVVGGVVVVEVVVI
jgi:hypothetical protein